MFFDTLRPGVYLNTRNDAKVCEGFGERSAIVLSLPNGFIVENGTADRLGKTRRVDDQFSILATGLGVLRNPPFGRSACCKPQYFHRSPTDLSVGDHLVCSAYESLKIHSVSLHFQFRISGISWP